MNTLRLACGVFAAALFVAGCGEKPYTAPLQPRIPAGTSAAFVARDHVAIAPVTKPFKDFLQEAEKSSLKEDRKIAAVLRDSGLTDAQIRWMAATVGEITPPAEDGTQATPEMAYVISCHHDIEQIVAALKKQEQGRTDALTPGEFAGIKGWRVVPADKDDLPPDVAPCFASLGGELLLLGSTPAALERVIRLYSGDAATDAAFANFGTSSNMVLAVRLAKLDKLIGSSITPETITQGLPASLPTPAINHFILGLDRLDFNLVVAPDQRNLKASLRVAATNAQDAADLRTPLQLSTSVLKFGSQLKMHTAKGLSKDEQLQLEVIKSLSVGGTGTEIRVSAALPIEMLTNSVSQVASYRSKSQGTACQANLKTIQTACEAYKTAENKPPKTLQDLCGEGKLLRKMPKCPCGGSYQLPQTADGTPTCSFAGHRLAPAP